MPRFSKAAMLDYLRQRMEYLEKEHKFDPRDGWAQVERKGEEVNRAYGAYAIYKTLRTLIGDCVICTPRFTKTAILEHLRERAAAVQTANKFTTQTGYAQVIRKGEEKNRAYGEWDALMSLYENVEDGYISL